MDMDVNFDIVAIVVIVVSVIIVVDYKLPAVVADYKLYFVDVD